MSHSDDYFEKYGFMIEENERREKAALTEQMRKWLLSGARLLCGYYNEVAESAAAADDGGSWIRVGKIDRAGDRTGVP